MRKIILGVAACAVLVVVGAAPAQAATTKKCGSIPNYGNIKAKGLSCKAAKRVLRSADYIMWDSCMATNVRVTCKEGRKRITYRITGSGGPLPPPAPALPSAAAAKPKMTKAQAKRATAKFVRKDSRLTPKTVKCTTDNPRSGYKCEATADMASGGTCIVGVVVLWRNGKPWATGDKFTSREPESCAQKLQ